ncbi:MAG: type IV toxin-antitoxin system AbiEi family antitoxin domain-containing protein [Terriglobales bacterium]
MPQQRAWPAARNRFTEKGGMLRTSVALRLGIHPRTLYAMRDAGEIERVGPGLYRLADRPPLSNPDWVTVALRVPRAVICLISALSYHDLTTQVPHQIDVVLPSHAQAPRMRPLPIRVFWYSEAMLRSGVAEVEIDGVRVRIFTAEKTIADCFKYRNKIGIDIAVEALRLYRERTRRPKLAPILEYARIGRVEKIVRPYLEALL